MYTSKTSSGYKIRIPHIFKKYEVVEFIGCGSFSVVYKVQDTYSHQYYSAKIISMKDMNNQGFNESVYNEINILRKIDHQNIMKYIESFSIRNDRKEKFFVIITEYCSNGDLLNFLNNPDISNEDIKFIIRGLAEGIKYLHSMGIAHCDLKLTNVLIDENFNPKICDFNLSKDVNATNDDDTCGGTYPYSAPEVIESITTNFFKADIWSFGILIYVISVLDFPFEQDKNGNFLTNHLLIETQDEELKELVEKCTKRDPNDRIDADKLLDEPYFSEKSCLNSYDDDNNYLYFDDVDDYIEDNGKNFNKKNKQANKIKIYNHKTINYY